MKRGLAGVVFWMLSVALTVLGAAETSAYRVLLLGDLHHDGPEYHSNYNESSWHRKNIAMWESRTPQLLRCAAERARLDAAAFVVQLGDITEGDADSAVQERMLRRAVAVVKSFFPERPLAVIGGNHDLRTRDTAPAEKALWPFVADELGMERIGDGNYFFLRGRDLFIAVNGFVLAKEITGFVKRALDSHPDTRYVFFLTHLPVFPASPGSPTWLLPGNLEVAAMLETRRAVIFAGHTHSPAVTTRTTPRGKLTQVVLSSLGHRWEPKRLMTQKVCDWPKFSARVRQLPAKGKNKKLPVLWPKIEAAGSYAMSRNFANSDFAVLDVDDSRVEIRLYTDGTEKPAETLTLFAMEKTGK